MKVNRGDLVACLAAFPFFCILTAALFVPVLGGRAVGGLSTTVLGEGGDTLGEVYDIWWTEFRAAHGLTEDVNPLLGYPFGTEWRPRPPTVSVFDVAFRLLRPLGGEILRFNVLMFLSFPLSGITTFLLARRLSLSFGPSLLAGALYAFSPYILAHYRGNLSLTHAEFLPLLLLLAVDLLERPRWWRAAVLGGAIAVTTLAHAYYAYIGAVLIATATAVHWLKPHYFPSVSPGSSRAFFMVAAAALFAGAMLMPIILPIGQLLLDPGLRDAAGAQGVVRPVSDFVLYAAQPWQYLVPPSDHLLLGTLVRPFWDSQPLPGEVEFRLYVGLVPLLAAIAALDARATRELTPRRRYYRFLLVVILATAFLFSVAPRVWPSSSLLPMILPMFRNYARFGAAVTLSVALLAALGMELLLPRIGRRWQPLAMVSLLTLALADRIPREPLPSFDAALPEPYAWLATLPQDLVIAEYPFLDHRISTHQQYVFAQRVHQKAMVNVETSRAQQYDLYLSLQNLEDPEVPARLAALGADYALVHDELYRRSLGTEPPDLEGNPAFELVRSDDSLKVYRILAKPIDLARDVTFENGIRLLQAQAFVSSVDPHAMVTTTVTLDLPPNLPPGHGLFVHLNDISEQTVAQASVSLPPSNPWPPRLATREPGVTFDLRIPLPRGFERERLAYRIGITDSSLHNLTVTEGRPDLVGRKEVAAGSLIVRSITPPAPPTNPASVQFADGLALLGFDPPQLDRAGATVQLRTLWSKRSEGNEAYTQFYHVLDEAGRLVAQQDQLHTKGRYPTSVWSIGEVVPETVQIALPRGLAPGAYKIALGLYDSSTGERLPILSSSLPFSQNSVVISSFVSP